MKSFASLVSRLDNKFHSYATNKGRERLHAKKPRMQEKDLCSQASTAVAENQGRNDYLISTDF